MLSSWTGFLDDPPAEGHAVQIYTDSNEIVGSVVRYLLAGFARHEPAVVIATQAHRRLLSTGLRKSGWSAAADTSGLLTILDAEPTLDVLMGRSGPSPLAFEQVVGSVFDAVALCHPGRTIRAYGEMVDLLSQADQMADAVALEGLWNQMSRTRRFALLCSYRLDLFDVDTQRQPMPQVCQAHSHVLPSADLPRLTRSVDAALREVIGEQRAEQVAALAQEAPGQPGVPLAQRILMSVTETVPSSAERILARARWHYRGEQQPALA